MQNCEVLILGGGLSGLTCAAELQNKSIDCILVEKESRLGGLTRTRHTDGFTYDCHGGHVFNTRNKEVKDWVFSYMPEDEWTHSRRIAKIWYKGKMISYPFELALAELKPEEATECIIGILKRKGSEPKSLEKWLRWNFGEAIANKYLLPYNRKIWRRELSKMSAHWVKGKMPLPNIEDIIFAALNKSANEEKMVHSSYYYPNSGGIESFIKRISKTLKNIELNTPLETLEFIKGRFVVNGEFSAKKIISTIPLTVMVGAINKVPEKVKKATARFDWNPVTTILAEQKKTSSLSWLYLPEDDLTAHRIVYQGDMAKKNCPKAKSSATYEITGIHKATDVIKPFKNKKLPVELRAIDTIDSEYTEHAYPVYHLSFLKDISVVRDWFDSKKIISCGRFAEWKYYNMDDCIGRAIKVTEKLSK
jgi:protoporphyrinogen oxidase